MPEIQEITQDPVRVSEVHDERTARYRRREAERFAYMSSVVRDAVFEGEDRTWGDLIGAPEPPRLQPQGLLEASTGDAYLALPQTASPITAFDA